MEAQANAFTPHAAFAHKWGDSQYANDAALLFNLSTHSGLHAEARLDGYAENAQTVVAVSYVRELRHQPTPAKVVTHIGYLTNPNRD